jgi:hypothetical protein
MARALDLLTSPFPLRWHLLRFLDKKLNILSYERKLKLETIDRASYGFCLFHAASLARKLRIPRISAIEFGVAGGNGLVSLERHADHIQRETGVEIEIYGFDTGCGLPQIEDHRDMPYLFAPGFFTMDLDRLRQRLKRSQVVIGDIRDTISKFFEEFSPAPVGFISFDLDLFSSTTAAFQLLEEDPAFFLPRTVCYFDDVVGGIEWGYHEFGGELLAIKCFNEEHSDRKVARVAGLRHFDNPLPRSWQEQIYLTHFFSHPRYSEVINDTHTELPLRERGAGRRG